MAFDWENCVNICIDYLFLFDQAVFVSKALRVNSFSQRWGREEGLDCARPWLTCGTTQTAARTRLRLAVKTGGPWSRHCDSVELMCWSPKLLFAWDYWSASAHIYRRIRDFSRCPNTHAHAVRGHSRKPHFNPDTHTCTRFPQSRVEATSPPHRLGVLPVVPSGRVDVLLLWQARWNWQRDLYSGTNAQRQFPWHGWECLRVCMCVFVFLNILRWAAHSGQAGFSSAFCSKALCFVLMAAVRVRDLIFEFGPWSLWNFLTVLLLEDMTGSVSLPLVKNHVFCPVCLSSWQYICKRFSFFYIAR